MHPMRPGINPSNRESTQATGNQPKQPEIKPGYREINPGCRKSSQGAVEGFQVRVGGGPTSNETAKEAVIGERGPDFESYLSG